MTCNASAADQPQWGQWQTRNMVSSERNLPDGFDPKTGRNVRWIAELGTESYSTPVIVNGKVLVGTNNEQPRDPKHQGDRGVLMCFDEKDGRLCWQLVVPKLEHDPFGDWTRVGIVSPATVEGDSVYLFTNRGEVACLDLDGMADGNDGPVTDEGRHMVSKGSPPTEPGPADADVRWLFDIAAGTGVHQHDAGHCSVLVDGPFLYVCTSNGVDRSHRHVPSPDAPSLIVLDKATGRLVAVDDEKIGPRIIHCTWSSPAAGTVNGRRLIFFGGGDAVVYAFDALRSADAGQVHKLRRAWKFDCDPEAPKENVHEFQDNRQHGPSTITGMPVFHENRIYLTVGGDLWHGKLQAHLVCLPADRTGDITKAGPLWSYPLERHCMSTPSVADGLVYVGDCGRNVHCVDAATGKPCWTHKTPGDIWSSTLVADGKVYVTTRRGDFIVFAAGREKKILSSLRLDTPVNASPTAANGVLYVTTMNRLYAIERR
jgi:outer membrane protein assembly factor BamB